MPKVKRSKNKPRKKDAAAAAAAAGSEVPMNKDDEQLPPVVLEPPKNKFNKPHEKVKDIQRRGLLLKSVPHEFFEEQTKQYFKRFGTVTQFSLAPSNNRVSVEFENAAAAQAASKDYYLKFQHVTKTQAKRKVDNSAEATSKEAAKPQSSKQLKGKPTAKNQKD